MYFVKDEVRKEVEEIEAKLQRAIDRLKPIEDGASHEDMADAYEVAFDYAADAAERAIKMLRLHVGMESK
jgi:hypothetical protein